MSLHIHERRDFPLLQILLRLRDQTAAMLRRYSRVKYHVSYNFEGGTLDTMRMLMMTFSKFVSGTLPIWTNISSNLEVELRSAT